jgi:hypothetical protein
MELGPKREAFITSRSSTKINYFTPEAAFRTHPDARLRQVKSDSSETRRRGASN